MATLTKMLRTAALQLLTDLAARGEKVVDARVDVAVDGTRCMVAVYAAGRDAPSRLRAVDKAALRATGKVPVTVKVLARKAKHSYSSHFRDAVRRLIDAGLVVRVSGGIRLP